MKKILVIGAGDYQVPLIKKIIAAVMVFFVISIVQFVISKVADSSEQGGIESCLSCFLNNSCDHISASVQLRYL